MSMVITYKVHNNLYINLTNECPCSCTFCLRQDHSAMDDSGSLWLEHTPDESEVLAALDAAGVEAYDEVVFCGFGEPTEALYTLLSAAAHIKEKWNKPVRVNTNGLGNLINKRDVPPLFAGLVDTVSISLNTPDPDRYYALVRPRFGKDSWHAMINFAEECVKYVPNVVLTTVATTISKEEEEKCAEICASIGAKYRIRAWEA